LQGSRKFFTSGGRPESEAVFSNHFIEGGLHGAHDSPVDGLDGARIFGVERLEPHGPEHAGVDLDW
jgi:hypothetical protein